MGDPTSLTNHLLIAMPTLGDPDFAQSVTLVCEHSTDKGALGIVVNKPLPRAYVVGPLPSEIESPFIVLYLPDIVLPLH